MIGKIIALIIGGLEIYLFYSGLISASSYGEAENGVYNLVGVLFALSLIWFSDDIGNFTTDKFFTPVQHPINQTMPGIFIKIMGWIFLLLPFLMIPLYYFVTAP